MITISTMQRAFDIAHAAKINSTEDKLKKRHFYAIDDTRQKCTHIRRHRALDIAIFTSLRCLS